MGPFFTHWIGLGGEIWGNAIKELYDPSAY